MFSSLEGTKKSAMSGFVKAKRVPNKYIFSKRTFLGGEPANLRLCCFFEGVLVVKHGHLINKKKTSY